MGRKSLVFVGVIPTNAVAQHGCGELQIEDAAEPDGAEIGGDFETIGLHARFWVRS